MPLLIGRLASGLRQAGAALSLLVAVTLPDAPAIGCCGLYVAQADGRLATTSSKVVLAWDDGAVSMTMAGDYFGDPKRLALIVPVPAGVERKDIRTVAPTLLDKIDAYSAPRLAEYFDYDPCAPQAAPTATPPVPEAGVVYHREDAGDDHDTKVEARYVVGAYDIVVLSAKDSDGLTTWLKANDYRIPDGAGPIFDAYIKQGMRFVVAKVDLERHKLAANGLLAPLQVSYRSKTLMLPIRLGMLNARNSGNDDPQDLVVVILSRKGRVEAANHQMAKMPSGAALPLYVKATFDDVYKRIFDRQVEEDGPGKIYTEYAWDMRGFSACDPCAAPVPTAADLFALGARWHYPELAGADATQLAAARFPQTAADAYITRLHLRYDAAHFPEDLTFTETADRDPNQTIYKLRHPVKAGSCAAGREYRGTLPERFAREAKALSGLTGWSLGSIRRKMEASGESMRALE